MFRYLVLVCIFIICSYIGFVIGENYKKRSVNLKEFQKAILLMNNDVIYTNIPLMEDYSIVSDFFRTLGETGVFGQEKIFKLASEQVKLNYQEALKEAKVNIKMYRTLGVCAGALIVIFFI